MYWPTESETVKSNFEKDIKDVHLIYYYAAKNPETGADEKWKYEMWFYNESRIVYAIHGGPMAGRLNYQQADYQCIRPGELWQCNWTEETGTICSLVYDIPNKKITTLLNFSKGHWDYAEKAHGNKRNPKDFERWRELAKIGNNTSDRYALFDQADIAEHYKGPGNLEPIEMDWPTL
ncbi:hypothetical protein CBS101457_002252 [Exobasidium rhododendri]|nr:hypothetical protein CBS101457_002252 [Exobasidium rhododendri]